MNKIQKKGQIILPLSKDIHFHSGDERSCPMRYERRQFTVDSAKVTCEECKANDGTVQYVLSQQAIDYLARLDAEKAQELMGTNSDGN